MMILTNKSLPRRAFLRGLGAVVGLPLLDSMLPPMHATTRLKSARRLGIVYVPNGVIMEQWTPKTEGAAFDWSPTLQPLDPFRSQVTIISGLDTITRSLAPPVTCIFTTARTGSAHPRRRNLAALPN